MPRVGEYELGKTIGQGAYSKVKLCTHIPTNTTYVAKIISKTNADVEIEIRVEIGILRKIKHPNVVNLIEILESGRHYYIILEAVMGGDLCDRVISSKTGLPEPEARSYFTQIVKGLVGCHQAGVAHRDIKPENLLLSEDGTVKISDFGLSRLHQQSHGQVLSPAELAKTLTGTLAYVAPEVLLGSYDAFKADLWSVGCLLYVMLSCHFPFGSATDLELESRIKEGRIEDMPATVSASAQDLVKKLIKKDPQSRLSLQEILAHPWVTNGSTKAVEALDIALPTRSEIETDFGSTEEPDESPQSPHLAKKARPKLS